MLLRCFKAGVCSVMLYRQEKEAQTGKNPLSQPLEEKLGSSPGSRGLSGWASGAPLL